MTSSVRLAWLLWALWVICVAAAVAASGGRSSGHGGRRHGNGPTVAGDGRGSHTRSRKDGPSSARRGPPAGERSIGRGKAGSEGPPRQKRQQESNPAGRSKQVARVPAGRAPVRSREAEEDEEGGLLSWLGLGGSAKAWLREAKAALSSELEGVMLKATRPDDDQVKLKHLELLLAITYQTPPELDPFPPILRKLWSKMQEGDYRTSLKALYILHRLAANGAVEQAEHLQARLSDMMRQVDSRNKAYFFKVESIATEGLPFVHDYAAYVLYRACHFSPGFMELTRLGLRSEGEAGRTLTPRESEALLELLEEVLRRAFTVRLTKDGGEVTELSSMCAEAIFFDVQQVLDILAEILSAAPSTTLHPDTCQRFFQLYHRALQGINAFVADQAALVAPHGVTLREMKSALEGRQALAAGTATAAGAHPLIEEAESSDEDGPVPEPPSIPAAPEKKEQPPPVCRPADGQAGKKEKRAPSARRPPPSPPRRPKRAAGVESVRNVEQEVRKKKRPLPAKSKLAEGKQESIKGRGRSGEKPRGRKRSSRRKSDDES